MKISLPSTMAFASFSLALSASLQTVFVETFILAAASSKVRIYARKMVLAQRMAFGRGKNPILLPTDLTEELKALQDYKKELEAELAELTKRIEELKKQIEKK